MGKIIFAICLLVLIVILFTMDYQYENNKAIIGQTAITIPGDFMIIPNAKFNGIVGGSASISRYNRFGLITLYGCSEENPEFYPENTDIQWGNYVFKIIKMHPEGSVEYKVLSYTRSNGETLTEPQ